MKQLAIIGPTASGKSALALDIAIRYNAFILSLDSLSVYKEIDIASAKPSKDELSRVRHFGIDEIYPNEHFNAKLFFDLYINAKDEAQKNGKNLIIVGGTGFYLYALTNGLSETPQISTESMVRARQEVENLPKAYENLLKIDELYASKISSNDSYRIQKAYEIYFESGQAPTKLFAKTNKEPLCPDLAVFEIETDRAILRDKIRQRTTKMLDDGLVDEVETLLTKYGKEPKSMKSIGIAEILDFLDGKTSLQEASELISIHTGQLAKRQETFNRGKFGDATKKPIDKLQRELEIFLEAP